MLKLINFKCTNHVLYVRYFGALTSGTLPLPPGLASSLRQNSPVSTACCSNGALILWATTLLPVHPRARYQAPRDSPMPQIPLKLFKLTSSKPTYPPCLFSPTETIIKTCPYSLSPSASWVTLVPPTKHGMTSPWDLEYNHLSNGSCLILCWLPHTQIIIKPQVPQERVSQSQWICGLFLSSSWRIIISVIPPALSLSQSWLAHILYGQLLKVPAQDQAHLS